MSQALTAAMAPDLDLPDGYTVVWSAIDPVTGADIANVTVSAVSIFGTGLGTGTIPGDQTLGPYFLVPGPDG